MMEILQVLGAFHPEWFWSQGPGCSSETAQWPEQKKPSGVGQSYSWYKQLGTVISVMSWILHRWYSHLSLLAEAKASFNPANHVIHCVTINLIFVF